MKEMKHYCAKRAWANGIHVALFLAISWSWTGFVRADEYSGDWKYVRQGRAVTITGYYGRGVDISIPSAIDGLPVTRIDPLNDSDKIYYITRVTIPATVTHITSNAFNWCQSLQEFAVEAANPAYGAIQGVLVSADRRTLMRYPLARRGDYTIPSGILWIGDRAFDSCSGLTRLVIPDHVVAIGASALRDCYNMQMILVGSGVKTIGSAGLDTRVLVSTPGWSWYEGAALEVCFMGDAPAREEPFGKRGEADGYPDLSEPCHVYVPSGSAGWGAEFGGLPTHTWTAPTGAKTGVATQVTEASAVLNGLVIAARRPVHAWFEWGPAVQYGHSEPAGEAGAPGIVQVSVSLTNLSAFAWYHYRLVVSDGVVTNYGTDVRVYTQSIDDFDVEVHGTEVGITRYHGAGGQVRIPPQIRGLPVTTIEGNAFEYVSEVITIFIPDSVRSLGDRPLVPAPRLTGITVSGGNPIYSSRDGVLFSKDGATLLRYPPRKEGAYTMPEGVRLIEPGAFGGTAVTELTVASTVNAIGTGAFFGCELLKRVDLPEFLLDEAARDFAGAGVTDSGLGIQWLRINGTVLITSFGWDGAEPVSGMPIPSSLDVPRQISGIPVARIADGAMAERPAVTNVWIPESIIQIGNRAFRECPGLLSIKVADANTAYSSREGVLYDKSGQVLVRCPAARTGAFVIPEDVTTVSPWAFEGNGWSEMVVSDRVRTIGENAFAGCVHLAKLLIGRGVVRIEEGALDTRVLYCRRGGDEPVYGPSYGDSECKYDGAALDIYVLGQAPQAEWPFGRHNINDEVSYAWPPPRLYHVKGTAGWGADFGGVATMPWPGGPIIVRQPQSATVYAGKAIRLAVSAFGSDTLSYQWRHDGQGVPESTEATLILNHPNVSDAGLYQVFVRDSSGTVTSDVARVSIRTVTPNSYEAVAVALGPMAYWPLDETNAGTASDFIGGANGVYGAAVVLGWPGATANTGTSAGFNGWNANVQAGLSPSLDVGTGDFTVAAWIYPEDYAQSGIVSRGGYNWAPGWLFDFNAAGMGTLRLETSLGFPGGQGTVQTAPGVVKLREWQHVAVSCRRDPGVQSGQNTTRNGWTKIYLNGKPVQAGDIGTGDLTNPYLSFTIASIANGGGFFPGRIDEVALYGYALSGEQMAALYAAGMSTPMRLQISKSLSGLTLVWSSGVLQSADRLGSDGNPADWKDLAETKSPYTVHSTNTVSFYRLRAR